MTCKFIIGCGYLGRRVASHYRDQGERVIGQVRRDESVQRLAAAGIESCQLDLDAEIPSPLLPDACDLFYFAPPPRQGEQEPRVARVLAALETGPLPRRLLYLSTTGVYGDCQGAWVDETRPVQPVEARALRRWDGESRCRDWCAEQGVPLVVLRVAGIYGPGKLPLARLRRGEPMLCEREAPFTNRIHIDDLVQVCLTAMARAPDGALYNVSDGQPGNMADYFNRVADWAGLPRPPEITLAEAQQALSPGMLSYLRESRRLDSRRLQEELGVVLRYPDLASGLAACGEP